MSIFSQHKLPEWLPSLSPQIWILAFGRFLSQTGTGFTIFYTTIFFVNQVGLSATQVGLGLGSAQVSGIIGRLLSGVICDSPKWGRKRTLLLSCILSGIASFLLASSHNFSTMVTGNLLMGFALGLYWPATETIVADLTVSENRKEAFAVVGLADNLGLQVGIILGGLLIVVTGNYRTLFIIDGISYLIFLCVIYVAIQESYQTPTSHDRAENQDHAGEVRGRENPWIHALHDRALLIYVIVNIIFTLYVAILQNIIPLYFTNFVKVPTYPKGFSTEIITGLFALNTFLSVILQLPIVRYLRHFSHVKALMISASLWGISFILIGLTGMLNYANIIWAILGLGISAIALVCYLPSASALVADLAPDNARGIYLSINSQCWGMGYLIGPPLGGLIFDQGKIAADNFWVGMALSVAGVIFILRHLDRALIKIKK